jgi:inner membrane protein
METVVKTVWNKSKVLVKGFMIFIIVLILQIPAFYVRELVEERENRQKEAIAEVSGKWAGKQTVTGPAIVIPYLETSANPNFKPEKHYATFLPNNLKVQAAVEPQEKYRGIYRVMLYTATVELSGSFNEVALSKLNIPKENILWDEAYVKIHVTDVKGLNDEMVVNWNDQSLTLAPNELGEGLAAPLHLKSDSDLHETKFSAVINLNGSDQLLFTPIGKSTTVTLNSKWPHPSFTGEVLPQETDINENGFTANWKSLSHKRNFPQQWKDNDYKIETNSSGTTTNIMSTAFGANLFIPVNSYQKTMRSIKYAALCILLTFAAFFLIETNNKKSIHPFQYGLIGLALIIFYSLLLSLSEYIGFNPAYLISALCTIVLITWFVKGLLQSTKFSALLSAILVLMYTYVFTILQLQDYALLLGSIGLFITLAIIMQFSKKFQW